MKDTLSLKLLNFAKNLVWTVQKKVQLNYVNQCIVENLIKCWTNCWVDYLQAGAAPSKKMFIYKMNVAKNCMNEAVYWLEMLIETDSCKREVLQELLDEAKEISKILNRITWTLKKNAEKEIV